MLVSLIWGDFRSEIFLRVLAVASIVVGLLTLLVPLLMKLRKGEGEVGARLVLTEVGGGLYEDSTGQRYQVSDALSESIEEEQ